MADQLWVVFLDGVAQEGALPYTGSEEKALSLWREQTGLGRIARARLRAVPKAEDRTATALTIVRDIAYRLRDENADVNGADFLDYVYGELDKAGFIAEARVSAAVPSEPIPSSRPAVLTADEQAALPVDPSDETKGYRCWVVTSRKPHRTRAWLATRRAEAVSQVKDAVRNHRTEGGVESRDPRRPFEATFSLMDGKIVTTKFTA